MAALVGAALFLNRRRERVRVQDISDFQLKQQTRFDRASFNFLLNFLEDNISRHTRKNHAIKPDTRLLVALNFYASGGFQWICGNSANVSQASVSLIVDEVTNELINLVPNFIRFPRLPQERMATTHDLYEVAGMPKCLGLIDCTHISIMAPKEHEEHYVNRKQRHTMNMQVVCDASMQILDVSAKFPGSVHDSFIWRDSVLREECSNGLLHGGFLLGDSGYPLEPWLMTPVRNPVNKAEENYNRAHKQTRAIVERCFGLLKSRFRCLHESGGTLQYTPDKVCKIFVACCILHNMLIERGVHHEDLLEEEINELLGVQDPEHPDLEDGRLMRHNLIEARFQNVV